MDSRLTTFNKQRTAWREMERNGLLALLSREGVIISVSIYTTFLVTFLPWVLTVSTVSPPR